jgi:hypothetical protein
VQGGRVPLAPRREAVKLVPSGWDGVGLTTASPAAGDAVVRRGDDARLIVDVRVFGGDDDLPDLPQPAPENVFDMLQRVPAHLDALLAAAAPLTKAGRDRPLDWDERMRLRDVLLFAEALRDHDRGTAALARDRIITPAPIRRPAGSRPPKRRTRRAGDQEPTGPGQPRQGGRDRATRRVLTPADTQAAQG